METRDLKGMIQEGGLDALLEELYGAEVTVLQRKRYCDAIEAFEGLYGAGDVSVYSAPGRTEIGGNHTDHQHGKVLAAAVDLDVIAIVRGSEEERIRILSEGYPQFEISTNDLVSDETQYGTTQALVKGILAGFVQRGYAVCGFDAYITGNVPSGSGLSSSAAFEILIGTILSGLKHDMSISPVELAQIGQYAENVYFGKPCRLMDQMACSVGDAVYIDFADPKNPIVEQVELSPDKYGYCLCITDTLGSHAGLTHEYAAILQEMKQIASYFGKEVLREVSQEDVLANLAGLRERYGDRSVLRTLHFFRENVRVEEECNALKTGDFKAFLAQLQASGDSSYKYLQNLYTMQNPKEQNLAIAIHMSEAILGHDGACRVHGGGFAGTIQAFVQIAQRDTYRQAMDGLFGENACRILRIRKYGGIKVAE